MGVAITVCSISMPLPTSTDPTSIVVIWIGSLALDGGGTADSLGLPGRLAERRFSAKCRFLVRG